MSQITTDELTPEQTHDFDVLYGCLFSLNLAVEYLDAIGTVIKPMNAKNAHGKVINAEAILKDVQGTIKHAFTKNMAKEQADIFLKAVDVHSDLVYEFFSLPAEHQTRVKGLIDKLKKERA